MAIATVGDSKISSNAAVLPYEKSKVAVENTAKKCRCAFKPVHSSGKAAHCRRKVSILSDCKCGEQFCIEHRLPFNHNCSFDHHEFHAKQIDKILYDDPKPYRVNPNARERGSAY